MGLDQQFLEKTMKIHDFPQIFRGSFPGLCHFPENSYTNGWPPYMKVTLLLPHRAGARADARDDELTEMLSAC